MKVDILDNDVFNAISPLQVERYLETRNWVKKRILPNDVSIWDSTFRNSGRRYRIWLPEATDLADYPEAMAKVVRVIAEYENRSQLQILDDFETTGIGDVIRLSGSDELNRYGSTLKYEKAAHLIQQAKDMTVAAAMSARATSPDEYRAVFPSRRPQEVQELERSLRLGQTEHGSYIIKLIVPLEDGGPEIDETKPMLPATPDALPFSRRAVMKLATGLNVLYRIGQETDKTGRYRIEPFVENIRSGVSANLCDAVSNWKHTDHLSPLNVAISWSYLLQPTESSDDLEIEFPAQYMRYYQEASEELRRKEPATGEFYGWVRMLSRDRGASEGEIKLLTVYEGRPRVVQMLLEGEDYQKALASHEKDLYISVTGNLVRESGRTLRLESPRNVFITQSLPLQDE